jgi:quercetin dioxygenase-like cupin family protein
MEYIRRDPAARENRRGALFIGTALHQTLSENEQVRVGEVAFEAGARTKWHKHTFHQTLVITEGRGVVATETEERHVTPGDVCYIPPGTNHWHGAEPDHPMAHISINGPGETTF